MKQRMTVLFFGTPEFALPTLRALSDSDICEVIGVVTQPDKPVGRGLQLTPPPVKQFALERGLPVFQPRSLKALTVEFSDGVKSLNAPSGDEELLRLATHLNVVPLDSAVVVASGKIVPKALLDFPRTGVTNIHPSLLPRWRGAAPIQHAIFAGDPSTGVSLMRLDEGLDTGPVYRSAELPIAPGETEGELARRLAELGATLVIETLPAISSGRCTPTPQEETGVTYAEKWDKEDLFIRWSEPAVLTERRIRASTPEPGARTVFAGEPVKVFSAAVVERPAGVIEESPGVVVESNRSELIVAAGSGSFLSLKELQFPGRKRLSVSEILRGRRISRGDRFGTE